MQLLPCKQGVCQCCAVDHPPESPHNQQSLYWQYWFFGQHGRWPTWADATAHCTTDVQKMWREALDQRGKWSEPENGDPIACVPDSESSRQPMELNAAVTTVGMEEP